MATLALKEMGKFLWEGRKKVLPSWLSQFSFDKLLENAKKNLVIHFGVGCHASFPQKPVVNQFTLTQELFIIFCTNTEMQSVNIGFSENI